MSSQATLRKDVSPVEAVFGRQHPDRSRHWRKRARLANLLVALLWLSGAIAGALAFPSVIAAQPGAFGGVITSVGIITGQVGTDLILVMLVLAARIPSIDRAIGHDRAIAVHRSLGKPALYLLLAHALLLLVGYGANQGIDPVAEIGSMLAIPDLPLAFFGLGGLVVVVVTSVVAVRRRFSYEGWHLIHLLSYAAVLIAVPHELSVGGILAEGTIQRAYWISLYILAFGAIVAYRFVEPTISSLRHRIRVDHVEMLAPGVASIHLRGHNLAALGASGGQYFVWRFWTARTWWHSHPISLSTVPHRDAARITVRTSGDGTKDISAVPPGTRVSIEGPYGIFTEVARTASKLAIVAAGIGVTPVRAMLEQADLAPGEATVLLRASREAETALWDETIAIAAKKGVAVYSMVGSRSRRGPRWMTESDARRGVTLRSIFPDLARSDLYICGPTAWLDLVAADARAIGLAPHQIHTERFEW